MAQILVIDDDDNFRKTLKEMLERAGYDVIEASNGQDGIDSYKKEFPDLVITDILMPNIDGAEVVSVLQKEFPDIKMIVMTGGIGRPEDYLKGDVTFSKLIQTLNKPFPMDELLQVVKEAVG